MLSSATSLHKYYVSVSEVAYSEEDQAIQVITRIFIDDFQEILQQRYDDSVLLGDKEETKNADYYVRKYFDKKFVVNVNGEKKTLSFVGKEYEEDMIICYVEVEGISHVKSISIENKLLFDLTNEQQNIVHFDINSKKRSFVLRYENDKGLLNF